MKTFEIGQHIELNIIKLGINGEGIGYFNKKTFFVDGALPNEKVSIEIKAIHPNYIYADLVEVLESSEDRIKPFCPYYEKCGGCQLQHLALPKILVYKRDLLIQALNKYMQNRVDERIIGDVIPSKHDTHYRNKASLPIRFVNGKNRFGMYMKNSNVFLPLDDCPVQNEHINKMLNRLVKLMDQLKIKAYDPKRKDGLISTAIIRVSDDQKRAQASLLILHQDPKLPQLLNLWQKHESMIESVFTFIDDPKKKTSFFEGQKTHIKGPEALDVGLGGYLFSLRPEAFFQLNYDQAHQFYQTMIEMLKPKASDVVIEAFSGVAPVSFYLSKHVKQIYAIEIDKAATQSAQMSIERMGILNIHLIQGDFYKVLQGFKKMQVDAMIFDPPRTGLGLKTIEVILKMKPTKLIYGSCNPSTLAKDLNVLSTMYHIVKIVPLDMFPYTSHVETITLLSLKTA